MEEVTYIEEILNQEGVKYYDRAYNTTTLKSWLHNKHYKLYHPGRMSIAIFDKLGNLKTAVTYNPTIVSYISDDLR
jgi:hypothetical protein